MTAPTVAEHVERIDPENRPTPAHAVAYAATLAAQRREDTAGAEVVRLRAELDRVAAELADAVDHLTARRTATVAAWDAEQRAAFGE